VTALGRAVHAVQRRGEHRLGDGRVDILVARAFFVLQVAQLGQPVPVHRVQEQARLPRHLQRAFRPRFTEHVLRHAGVRAAVFGIGIQDVQGDKPEVVGGAEAMALGHGLAVEQPFHLHGAVVDGGERRLEVSGLALFQDDVLEWAAELRRLGGGEFLLGGALVLRLQVFDLLQRLGVVSVQQQPFTSCNTEKKYIIGLKNI
jgi:hypothetical protein